LSLLLAFAISILMAGPDRQPLPAFDRVVVDADFPGVYQVEIAEVNGDGKPDIIALGGGTCAWYENPTWAKRVITSPDRTPGIISSAAADLDGDGRAEVAIAYEFEMNQPTLGKLGLAVPGANPEDPWSFRFIADVPSIHRLRWLAADDGLALVVAPIFGPSSMPPAFQEDDAVLRLFRGLSPAVDPAGNPATLVRRKVMHAVEALPAGTFPDRPAVVLTADNAGVSLVAVKGPNEALAATELVSGEPGEAPKSGCSEIRTGKLADGRLLLATVEPWHGDKVAVYLADGEAFGPRLVIDESLSDGHALCTADVDGDGDSEIFSGHRGQGYGVTAYDFDGRSWVRTRLDDDIAAQDLRAADLNGDGRPEIVGVGGKTSNVVLYRPRD
jgi:hypothetical protein